MVTWTARGSRGGNSVIDSVSGRCQAKSWWCRSTRVSTGRSDSTTVSIRAASRCSGSDSMFSTTTTAEPARASRSSSTPGPCGEAGRCPAGPGAAAAATASPATTTSPGRVPSASSPATRRSEYPRRSRARPQVAACTDTPSGPPRRNDTIEARGAGMGDGRGAGERR